MGLEGIVSKRLGSRYRSQKRIRDGNGFFRLRGFGCPRKFQTGNFRAFLLDPFM
jgi:hypothetical protein